MNISPAIETSALTRRFGARTAVDSLTLAIPAGSVFGFLGPNGAGKTTTIRMLTALIAPSAGSASVAGFVLGRQDQQIRRSVGMLTETSGLYDKLTPLQNLRFFAELYGVEPQDAAQRAARYLDMLGLKGRDDDRVGGFSKGMRQKLAIARALIHDPPVVFLDEPTSGLDPEAALTVRDFIRELRAEGRTIVLTTHNLAEADELCDLIGLFRTKLLHLDTPARLRASAGPRAIGVRLASAAESWAETVRGLPFVGEVTAHAELLTIAIDDPERNNPELVARLVAAGAPVRYVESIDRSLESVYLQLIGEANP